MTYPAPDFSPLAGTTQPKRKRRWPWILLAAGLFLLCGGILSAAAITTTPPTATPGFGEVVETPETTPNPVGTPSSWRLQPSDLELKIDVRDKECFGSAGCNIEFRLDGGVTDAVRARLASGDRSYEVRYEVSGFTDGKQVGTLEIAPDSSFVQDSFQFGQTPREGTKLKVRVIEVKPL